MTLLISCRKAASSAAGAGGGPVFSPPPPAAPPSGRGRGAVLPRPPRCRSLVELVARAADGEALFVQQVADAADEQHFVVLVVAPVAAALDRLQLGEFLFPVAQRGRLSAP